MASSLYLVLKTSLFVCALLVKGSFPARLTRRDALSTGCEAGPCGKGEFHSPIPTSPDRCEPCQGNTFVSMDSNFCPSCFPCTEPDSNAHQVVKEQCTPISDTVLGCAPNYEEFNMNGGVQHSTNLMCKEIKGGYDTTIASAYPPSASVEPSDDVTDVSTGADLTGTSSEPDVSTVPDTFTPVDVADLSDPLSDDMGSGDAIYISNPTPETPYSSNHVEEISTGTTDLRDDKSVSLLPPLGDAIDAGFSTATPRNEDITTTSGFGSLSVSGSITPPLALISPTPVSGSGLYTGATDQNVSTTMETGTSRDAGDVTTANDSVLNKSTVMPPNTSPTADPFDTATPDSLDGSNVSTDAVFVGGAKVGTDQPMFDQNNFTTTEKFSPDLMENVTDHMGNNSIKEKEAGNDTTIATDNETNGGAIVPEGISPNTTVSYEEENELLETATDGSAITTSMEKEDTNEIIGDKLGNEDGHDKTSNNNGQILTNSAGVSVDGEEDEESNLLDMSGTLVIVGGLLLAGFIIFTFTLIKKRKSLKNTFCSGSGGKKEISVREVDKTLASPDEMASLTKYSKERDLETGAVRKESCADSEVQERKDKE